MRSAVLRRSAAAFGVRRLHAAGTAWGLANPSRSVHDGGMAGADGRRKTGDRSGAMGEDDDQSLMGAIAQGDERAFSALVGRRAAGVRAIAYRFTGNATDAEDIVQEVFWRVWKGAAGWSPDRAKLSTWLYRITMNCCIDWSRREKRRPKGSEAALLEMIDPAAGPDRISSARSVLKAVREALLQLPHAQRFALLLSLVAGRSAREIGAAMQISEGAAEQLLVRARRTLRDAVRDIE